MNDLVIFGCGGHARSVADVVIGNDPEATLIFVDESAGEDERVFGFPVVSDCNLDGDFIVAIGDNQLRSELVSSQRTGRMISVISRDATLTRGIEVGAGCFVGHQAYVGPLSAMGVGCIVNTRALVEHEVQIEDFVQLGPGVVVGGRATIGAGSFIGMGAIIKDRVSISPGCIVGAGAVVVENLVEAATYVGIPARRVR